jgi:hypothetical protein
MNMTAYWVFTSCSLIEVDRLLRRAVPSLHVFPVSLFPQFFIVVFSLFHHIFIYSLFSLFPSVSFPNLFLPILSPQLYLLTENKQVAVALSDSQKHKLVCANSGRMRGVSIRPTTDYTNTRANRCHQLYNTHTTLPKKTASAACVVDHARDPTLLHVMLGLHGDILEIRVENIAEIIANCLCVNRVDSSVAGIL